ncbi:hypothetical protein F0562_017789 [Nyssa sinensis]|uniref:Tubby C-terminal domain-containing protein n=1 Tax=Nyssa sinensis TaxID=561372 RepID=A0A5J4ZK29_9ASTE|nr:hypothetical protein F0562_017789 [Nyssa sinensis]
MSRIHPTNNRYQDLSVENVDDDVQYRWSSSVLTVWKRSSMSFQGTDGFTVFDKHGRLAFRVDNYTRKNPCVTGGLILSMQCQWNGYRGEDGAKCRVFAMRRRSALIHGSSKNIEAEVFMGVATKESHDGTPDFRIEGSFRRRKCKIKSGSGELVAKIARKRVNSTILLSDEVFSLMVQPGFDPELIMAFVIILDRICHKPFAPLLCS